MATTTATFNISSTDLTDNALSVTNIATLTKAGNEEGLDTVISATKTFTATGAVDLVTVTGFTALNANKVYIANTGDSSSEYFVIGIESEEVGRLYGGDWMFIPWDASSGDDITINPSVATSMTCEYIVFS
jgi:hypothetical protein|tara:strand:- start:69 stop:461 length:393 start_codon:yes stop_codon:yes gene_type:complete